MALFVRRTRPETVTVVVVPESEPDPLWPVHRLIRTPGGKELFVDNVVDRLTDPADDLGLRPEPDAAPAGDPKPPAPAATSPDAPSKDPAPAAASTDASMNSSPRFWATLVATIAFLIGLLVAVRFFGTPNSGPTYTPARGIGAFALFYVAAQAAERFVELLLPHFEGVPGFGKARKVVALDQAVALASGAVPRTETASANAIIAGGEAGVGEKGGGGAQTTPAQAAADAQAVVDQLRANRTAIVFGFTAAIGMVMCGYLEADFLTAVGVDFSHSLSKGTQILQMAVTGLIVGGGSKGLHDTITSISKTSEKKSTPPETGG